MSVSQSLKIADPNLLLEKRVPLHPTLEDILLPKSRKLVVCVCCQQHRSPAKQEIKLFFLCWGAQHTQCAPVQFTRPFWRSP